MNRKLMLLNAVLTVRAGEHVSWAADTPHTYAVLGDAPVHASLLIRHPLG